MRTSPSGTRDGAWNWWTRARTAMADWDAPLAHEALARALAAAGDRPGAEYHLKQAQRLTMSVSDPEDRMVLEDQLSRGPWFDLAL
jgi:hypothetical protein